jgi:thymidylate kinase
MAPLCRKIAGMPLITFEGCGKSTQVKWLAARLEKCGIAAAVFREPGDGPVSVDAAEQQIWDALTQHFPDVGKHQTSNIKLPTS